MPPCDKSRVTYKMQKFTWLPDLGAQRSVKPLVNVTQFGDGYELRTASQINVNKRTWSMTFTNPLAVAAAQLDFLDAHQGRIAFQFVDPLGSSGVYVCRTWSSSQSKFGLYAVTADFEEVFEN